VLCNHSGFQDEIESYSEEKGAVFVQCKMSVMYMSIFYCRIWYGCFAVQDGGDLYVTS